MGHYIKQNERSSIPSRWVWLQAASQLCEVGTGVELDQAYMSTTRRSKKGAAWLHTSVETYLDPTQLWLDVAAFTRPKARTVVVIDHASITIRLTNCLEVMPQLGWQLVRWSLRDDSCLIVWRKDGGTLSISELGSHIPLGIGELSAQVGVEGWQAEDFRSVEHISRQRALVTLKTVKAYELALAEWMEAADLGNWRPTGAGIAWNNWRHKHLTHKVVADPDSELLDIELEAAGTGRAEAWRWGKLTDGPYTEWDMKLTYPTIAAQVHLPRLFATESARHKPAQVFTGSTEVRRLLHATVTQESPLLGTKKGEGWVWPVGTFSGWWWDNELGYAYSEGAHVTIDRSLVYEAAPTLQKWGQWVMDVVDDTTGQWSGWQRATVKHWGRALIGRFGVRYDTWEDAEVLMDPGVYSTYLMDLATSEITPIMVIGQQAWQSSGRAWGQSAVPSIMSVIMAEARVRLLQALKAVGTDHLTYMDTDSLVVDAEGSRLMDAYSRQHPDHGWRVKGQYKDLDIFGTRMLKAGGAVRVSGMPKASIQTGETTFSGHLVDGFATALSEGKAGQVTSGSRDFHLRYQDKRRQQLPGGFTNAWDFDLL